MFVPNILIMALEIKQSLVSGVGSNHIKERAYEGLPLKNARKLMAPTFDEICNVLEFDNRDIRDFAFNTCHVEQYNAQLVGRLRSGSASQRKLLWLILSYSIVPSISRIVGFWAQNDNLDRGMPGGRFWFLPTLDLDNNNELILTMPMTKVLDWLCDLLGKQTYDQITPTHTDQDSAIRTLNNWRKGSTIPQINKIKQYFHDDIDFDFKGCFEKDKSQPLQAQIEKAKTFIAVQGIQPNQLQHEIPINEDAIKGFIEGTCNDEMNEYIIELLSVRYAKPTNKKIRQRLMFARMVQNGYKRLVNYFHPDIQYDAPNPENKVIQLVCLFEHVYNASIDALNHHEEAMQDLQKKGQKYINQQKLEEELFERNIDPILHLGACVSLIKSNGSSIGITSSLINERLADDEKPDELEDIFPFTLVDRLNLTLDLYSDYENMVKDYQETQDLTRKLLKGNAYTALEEVTDYQLVASATNSVKHKLIPFKFCLARLADLAVTPVQKVAPLIFELEQYVYEGDKSEDGIQQTIQALLDNLSEYPDEYIRPFKPYFLRLQAHHALFQNQFEEAEQLLNDAFEACNNQYTGDFHACVAMELWGLILKDGTKLNTNNHDPYYRAALAHMFLPMNKVPLSTLMPDKMEQYMKAMYGQELALSGIHEREGREILEGIKLEEPSISKVAKEAETRFWNELYKPYKSFERIQPKVRTVQSTPRTSNASSAGSPKCGFETL